MPDSLTRFLEYVAFRPLAHAEQAWCLRTYDLVDKLRSQGCLLPPWIIWDLSNAASSAYCRPGLKACSLMPDFALWQTWAKGSWGPIATDQKGSPSQGDAHATLLMHLAAALGAIEGAEPGLPRDVHRWIEASYSDVTSNKWWDWPGGNELREAIASQEDPLQIIGTSAALETVTSIARCDPFLHSWNPAPEANEQTKPPAGNAPGRRSPQEEEADTGIFSRRILGRLPENLSRLSPIELLYRTEAPWLFFQRVAENTLEQRVFKRTYRSDRLLRVEVVIHLRDSPELHKFGSHSPPPINSFRIMLLELLTSLTRESRRGDVALDILFEYTDVFDNRTCKRMDEQLLGSSLLGNHRSVFFMLSRLVPSCFAHHPSKEQAAPDRRLPPKEFDRRYAIHLFYGDSILDTQPLKEGEGEAITCLLNTRQEWLIRSQGSSGDSWEAAQTTAAAERVTNLVLMVGTRELLQTVPREDWRLQ